MISKD